MRISRGRVARSAKAIRLGWQRLRRSSLFQNTAALYGIHAAGLLVPLVTVPYLARVLRPEGWGLVVFSQSFSAWLALVLEYGFYLSATRLIARVRDDRTRVAEVVAGVQGAKTLLLLFILAAGLLARAWVPVFRESPSYLLWAWLFAVMQGFSPFWYFQGMERMRAAALLEVLAKVLATIGVFLLVRQPSDGWLVLALQAVAGMFSAVVMTHWMYREIPLTRPRLRPSVCMLRDTAGLFMFRSASGLFVQANSFILGLLATAQVVAYFGAAERVIRAAINLIHPASQAIYPRISHLAASDREEAGRLLRLSLLLVGGLGLLMGLVAAVAAPLLIRLLLGPGYEAAVPVLRVLALLAPIIALGTVLGIQWALPMGLDRPFYAFVVAAGIINVLLALVLAPRWGAVGMAVSVVVADSVVTGGLLWLARHKGREIWRMRPRQVRRPRGPIAGRAGRTVPSASER